MKYHKDERSTFLQPVLSIFRCAINSEHDCMMLPLITINNNPLTRRMGSVL